ncbi:MAG: hypothetical protein PUF78_01595 [Lachnospiraceae bacterium]|nr:hypothetical protein [Lachnospiraceae bacterium]
MSLPEYLDFDNGYGISKGEQNATTEAQMKAYFSNHNVLMRELVRKLLWQPNRTYTQGAEVVSATIPENMVAYVSTAGTTGQSEPDWSSASIGDTFQDGSVKWTIRRKDVAVMMAEFAKDLQDQASQFYLYLDDEGFICAGYKLVGST